MSLWNQIQKLLFWGYQRLSENWLPLHNILTLMDYQQQKKTLFLKNWKKNEAAPLKLWITELIDTLPKENKSHLKRQTEINSEG